MSRASVSSTQAVLDHHLQCFGAGDLDGIMSDFSPDAVVFTPTGPIRGIDAVRGLFTSFVAEFGKPDSAFDTKVQTVEGDHAYIVWTADTPDNIYELGSDTFVVRDGKIVMQSYVAKATPKS
jgi:ketosteroid isomerase-like protein